MLLSGGLGDDFLDGGIGNDRVWVVMEMIR